MYIEQMKIDDVSFMPNSKETYKEKKFKEEWRNIKYDHGIINNRTIK
jgi:hypothetical protein